MSSSHDYDRASNQLKDIERYLGRDADIFSEISITVGDARAPGTRIAMPNAFAAYLGRLIAADLPTYIERVRAAARDDVRQAAETLRASLDADLRQLKIQEQEKGK
ncbi:hypothetical protein [Rhodopseudomonas sp. B29]|uniref:hypothetical protein n=1 Tax=Rhodopseudomonas sp. B29 TaxID=95607 RepID=UPI00034505B0|nr:hypothetical protein [Rhodopseudomonas sp. B29]